MNIHSKITDDSFPLLWKEIEKEGIETKKVTRTNHAIAIFSQIFFAIAIMLFGLVVFYFIFKNDSEALFIQEKGAKLIQFLPTTIPDLIKIIICLLLVLVLPAVCCLFVRFVFSLFSAKYQNNDMGKDGLCGAKAIQKAVNEFEKERTHYDITWDLPEHWAYHLIFSISFLLPVFIQLYILADKTNNEGIVGIILIAVLLGGLGGLILLLPIAGLKAVSNFLCNRTCFFKTKSKQNEYSNAIKELSKYISETERQIKIKERKLREEKESAEALKKQEKLQKDMIDGQKLYDEAVASEPVDDELMKKAAKLGNINACYYLGKKLFAEWLSDMYTAEEKEELASDAANYFDVARQIATLGNLEIRTECEFLWLYSRLQYERNTKAKWKEMLDSFRDIEKSGNLAEEYSETLSTAIKTVVRTIDNIQESQPTYESEPTKTLQCKFRAGAICTKNSNSVMIYHCNYVNDPSSCPTARGGGLELR